MIGTQSPLKLSSYLAIRHSATQTDGENDGSPMANTRISTEHSGRISSLSLSKYGLMEKLVIKCLTLHANFRKNSAVFIRLGMELGATD